MLTLTNHAENPAMQGMVEKSPGYSNYQVNELIINKIFLKIPVSGQQNNTARRWFLLLPFLLLSGWLSGQNQPLQGAPSLSENPLKAASSTTKKVPEGNDPLLFTFALTPEKSQLATDTLPDLDFRQFNPARLQPIDYATLGNLGSSAQPQFFEIQPQLGFSLGVNAFKLYTLHPQDLRFYRNRRSFSDAYFTQGKNNLETQVSARFARTFNGGANFSLEYRTINNLGKYNYQRDKHNALAAGLWVPVGKRYEGFLIFTQNVMRQLENGGIVSDTVFSGGEFQGPEAAAIRLPDGKAYTRYDDKSWNITHHFRFAGGDNAGARVLRATHEFEWNQLRLKFYDGDSTSGLQYDAGYYGPFLTNGRGIRNYVRVNSVDNSFTINTFKSKVAGAPSDLLALGIRHSLFYVQQEPNKSSFSNLFLTGDLAITPSKGFAFTANGALGLFKNLGEYQLRGSLKIGLGKAGEISGTLLSQRRPPDLLHNQLFVSQISIWNLNLQKPVENSLSATYALPLVGLEATARTVLVNNYLYYDQNGLSAQSTAPLQVAQILVRENIHLGWLHLDNTLALQKANRSDVFHFPKWFSQNSLYIRGPLFQKKLLLSAGFDFRMNGAFMPDGYNPVTAQFYLQDQATQQPFPWVDMFLAFKVQAFRFFARYENCYTFFDKTKVYYQTYPYPQTFGAFRLGISWRFLDDNVIAPGAKDKKHNPGGENSGNPTQSGPKKGGKI